MRTLSPATSSVYASLAKAASSESVIVAELFLVRCTSMAVAVQNSWEKRLTTASTSAEAFESRRMVNFFAKLLVPPHCSMCSGSGMSESEGTAALAAWQI